MIKNERQYQFTTKRLDDWEITLHQLQTKPATNTADWVLKAQIDGAKEEIRQLKSQLKEYEDLKAGKKRLPDLSVVQSLPSWLVKYRIAHNWTQKELADKLDMKEQQIQRYEETNYAGASLATLQKIASVLGQSQKSA